MSTLWSSWRMTSLKVSKPKLLNRKIYFWGCRLRNLHKCVSFSTLPSVFTMANGFCTPESISILWKLINLVTELEGKTQISFFYITNFFSKKVYDCFVRITFHFKQITNKICIFLKKLFLSCLSSVFSTHVH